MRTRSTSRSVQHNRLKRQSGTLEEFQPRPSSRARMEREISVASKTDAIEKSRLSVAGQTPHLATTRQEISSDGDRDQSVVEFEDGPRTEKIASAKALECENRSLKEELEKLKEEKTKYFQQQHNITQDLVSRGRVLWPALEQKSRNLKEQLTIGENLASYCEDMKCEIRSLKRKLEDAQRQIDQEVKKSHKLEGRLKITESQNETILCEIRSLKEKLEATQKDLEEERKFATNLMTENDSTTHEILSLQEKLETAKEQNIRFCQEKQELHEKQLL